MNNNNQNNFNFQMPPQYYQYAYEQQQYMIYRAKVLSERKKQKKELLLVGIALGTTLIAYLLLQTVSVGMLSMLGLKDAYESSPLMQYAFNVVAVHLFSMLVPFSLLALILKKNFVAPLVPTKKVSGLKAAAWVSLGMAFCLLANIMTSAIMNISKNLFGYELSQSEYDGPQDIITCVMIVISTAIIPAIIEEFSLRCCTLGVLKKYGNGFAVFVVSIIFGLMHGNVIQFVFAFTLGIMLAYITIKTNNIFIPMLIHGLNNGMSVLKTIIEFAANEKAGETVTGILFYIWGVLGIAALIYLATTKSFKFEKKPKNPYDNSFGTKVLCVLPGLALPFAILLYLTSQYVTKV